MKWLTYILIINFSILVSCRSYFNGNLGGGYMLSSYSGIYGLHLLDKGNVVIINEHIFKCSFDSTFIVLAQRPIDSIIECTGTIPGMTREKCLDAIRNSKLTKFWIINKRQENIFVYDSLKHLGHYSNVYGPFNEDAYNRTRTELGVSPMLKLDLSSLITWAD